MENKSDKIAVERTEPEKVLPRPDPEVPAKATRRRFSARYKLRILEQADGCESGEVGALLRREGLAFGNPGSGKTHLVCALGQELILLGRRVLFSTCALLVQ